MRTVSSIAQTFSDTLVDKERPRASSLHAANRPLHFPR
jgi:hypothetical protein